MFGKDENVLGHVITSLSTASSRRLQVKWHPLRKIEFTSIVLQKP